MTKYNKSLNSDRDGVKTPAEYNETTGQWEMPSKLTGSNVEKSSAQDTQVITTTKAYTGAIGATQIEVYVESGYVRVRTDGDPCTSTTGEPLAEGFGAVWQADEISVYYAQESVITVVSR